MYFYYDSQGNATSFSFEGMKYFYIKSQQGDVEKIVNKNGNVVVKYFYDDWGNLISMTDTTSSGYGIGSFNPYRYRGYVYDTETELYYLQSRYYDPITGRFINADVYTDTQSGTPLSTNMFAYCENNPVMGYDPEGYWDRGEHKTLCQNAKFNDTICQWAYNADDNSMCLASNEYYSAPFHSRSNSLNNFKCLYNKAMKIKEKKKMIRIDYDNGLIDGLKYIKKKNNKSKTEKAQNAFLRYINPSRFNDGECHNYKEQYSRIMGLALHTLQDYYSHCVRVVGYKENKKSITNYDHSLTYFNNNTIIAKTIDVEDNPKVFSWRYTATDGITRQVAKAIKNNKRISSISSNIYYIDSQSFYIYYGYYSVDNRELTKALSHFSLYKSSTYENTKYKRIHYIINAYYTIVTFNGG